MTSQVMLSAFFGYNQAMNARLWAIIMEHLSDEQFVAEDPYSRGSIRNQVVHMADALYYWMRGLLDRSDLSGLEALDYPSRAAARRACQQADQTCLDIVRELSEAELERIPEGWSQPVWVGLLQVAQHGTDHRAQVLRALHVLGAPTFEQNFAVYMENRTPVTMPEVLEIIQTRRGEWDELLGQVTAGQMDQLLLEEWTVRDAVAIVTWKEQRLTEILQRRVVSGVSFSELPVEEQAAILAASQELSLEGLLEEHQAAHQAMLAALRPLSENELNAEGLPGLPPDERFFKVIEGATWWGYAGFSRALRQLLERGG
jgi:uncharacterized damage-inducible protein DinB